MKNTLKQSHLNRIIKKVINESPQLLTEMKICNRYEWGNSPCPKGYTCKAQWALLQWNLLGMGGCEKDGGKSITPSGEPTRNQIEQFKALIAGPEPTDRRERDIEFGINESQILKEEINRTRELMGTITESQLLLEKPLSSRQRSALANCAVFGGGFWCAEGADECAKMLESGTDCECNPDSSGCGENVTGTGTKEPKLDIREGLLLEDKKFTRMLEACRAEVRGGEEESNESYGMGKKCKRFFKKYG